MLRILLVFFACVPALFLALAAVADPPSDLPPGRAALDGMVFSGLIGPEENPDYPEKLFFGEGRFWSQNCVACGFQPGLYWTRNVGDAVHFTATLKSRSGSVFHYDGIVESDSATVAVRWTKERWYWTIDRMLVFHGKRDVGEAPGTASQAGLRAEETLAGGLPRWCP